MRLAPRSSDVSVGTSPAAAAAAASAGSRDPARPGRVSVKLNRLNKTARLPNGMFVHYVSPPDVQFLYDEIYERVLPQARTRHRAGRRRHRRRRQHRPVRDVRRAEVSSGARVYARTPAPHVHNLRRNVRENLDVLSPDPGRREDQDDELPLADILGECIFLCDEDGDPASAENRLRRGGVGV